MKKLFYWLLVIALVVVIAFEHYERRHPAASGHGQYEVVESTTTEEVRPDTAPVPKDSVVLRYEYVEIPRTPPPENRNAESDSTANNPTDDEAIKVAIIDNDSIAISIPIRQTLYETEDYRAYVSGYNARLDSIFITSRHTVTKIKESSPNKIFSVGLQAGYGMTPKGFQPFIGVGVSVNLFSF